MKDERGNKFHLRLRVKRVNKAKQWHFAIFIDKDLLLIKKFDEKWFYEA